MIHDISGMTPDLRHQAEWLAGEGFLAVGAKGFTLRGAADRLERACTSLDLR